MTDTDRDAAVLAALDFPTECDGCAEPAVWLVTGRGFPCCTRTGASCDGCLAKSRRIEQAARLTSSVIACKEHDVVIPAHRFHVTAEAMNPNPEGGPR